ncbi:MAG TPA: serine/threonine-protein kinase, partial [Gemmataceae bacterium]|nr:serine/threonine-protein kinase [Gemmataceae bacterium]
MADPNATVGHLDAKDPSAAQDLPATCPPVGLASTVPPLAPQVKADGNELLRVPGYEVLSVLGRGGMGVVYLARDSDLERAIAIKVLLAEHANQPDYLRRFMEEARIMAQLQHPGVAPLHEIGKLADGRPFFAMKQVKGRTLADLLKQRQNPASELPQLLTIFTQVCQTLAYAHERRIIHRDLKPENVMVGAFGEVQVMDWGLAKVLSASPDVQDSQAKFPGPERTAIHTPQSDLPDDDRTQMGTVMGTIAYMAPEQALGQVELVDQRSD